MPSALPFDPGCYWLKYCKDEGFLMCVVREDFEKGCMSVECIELGGPVESITDNWCSLYPDAQFIEVKRPL